MYVTLLCHTRFRSFEERKRTREKYTLKPDNRKQVNEIDAKTRRHEQNEEEDEARVSKYFPKNSSNNRIQWKT